MEHGLKLEKGTNGTGRKIRKKVLMKHDLKSGKSTNGTGRKIKKKY